MKRHKLRVGDRIRIVREPGVSSADYYIHPDTARVFKKLIRRNRPVRIYKIDEYGQPWYVCKFRKPNGRFELHYLAVLNGESNWVRVQARKKQ